MALLTEMVQNRKAQFQAVKEKICDAFLKAQQESVWTTFFYGKLVWTEQKTLKFCSENEESESVMLIEEPVTEKKYRKEIIDWLKQELKEEGIDVCTREDYERERGSQRPSDVSNGDIMALVADLTVKMS